MRFHPAVLIISASLALAAPQSSQDSSVSTEYTSDSNFQQAILDVTNLYRRQHNASQLSWNDSLAEYAKDWSEDCKFEHSGGPSGENLASGYPNVTASVEAWGDEREEYDFGKGEFSYVRLFLCCGLGCSELISVQICDRTLHTARLAQYLNCRLRTHRM
jgi:type II secretory pathway pseudopilin PulG